MCFWLNGVFFLLLWSTWITLEWQTCVLSLHSFCSGCLMLGCSRHLKHVLLNVKSSWPTPPSCSILYKLTFCCVACMPQFSASGKSSQKSSLLLSRTAAACLNRFVWRIIHHPQFEKCEYLSLSKKKKAHCFLSGLGKRNVCLQVTKAH